MAHLTSLSELAVTGTASGARPVRLEVECEPAFCAVGPEHVAVGVNNQVGAARGWGRPGGSLAAWACQVERLSR